MIKYLAKHGKMEDFNREVNAIRKGKMETLGVRRNTSSIEERAMG